MVVAAVQTMEILGGISCELQGNYTLVGIDIDTTGRRLIDEIVQLAAYAPNDHYEQYIMPYMNLNPAARQRHQVRVISIGFYRMLKSMQTYKIIKSKSEIAALKDFLDWLENLKAKDPSSQGIIMIYHEERKFIPYMILESLKKYSLLDRFLDSVKAFANGMHFAKANVDGSLQHHSLRKLNKVLAAKLNENSRSAGDNEVNTTTTTTNNGAAPTMGDASSTKSHNAKLVGGGGVGGGATDLFDGNASVRAKLAFDVALQLANLKRNEMTSDAASGGGSTYDNMLQSILPYAQPIKYDLTELQTQNENLERQNSFRPVFLHYFKTTLYHRVRAVKFRIVLAEQGYDLTTLKQIWVERGAEGLTEIMQVMEELKAEDKTELVDLFDSYFDPAKTTIKPIVKIGNRRRNRRGGMRNNNANNNNNVRTDGGNAKNVRAGVNGEQGAGGDKQVSANQSPDTTTKSPNGSAGGKSQRGKRNSGRQRNNNNNNNTTNLNNNLLNTQTPIGDKNANVSALAPGAVVGMTTAPIMASN